MDDQVAAAAHGPAPTVMVRPDRFAPYRSVVASRLRAQRAYPASFITETVASLLVGIVELGEVWVLFHNVKVLGGLDFTAVLLVFGLANASFSIAEIGVGHLDSLPTYLRAGTLDVFYLRPQPLLAQLITSDVQLRRIARAGVGLICVAVALSANDVRWTAATIVMIVIAVVCGVAVYAALFVTAAGFQFFLINGPETTNAFVYGGSYASSQPAAVWPGPIKIIFGFLFPVAFCAYLPALRILDLPGPALLPSWLAWLLPVAAIWAWLVAMTAWRIGVRHYQGGGG